ncbi:MAG: penicillin-binding transpeptidase domain-containing protein [Polyangiaceae bacterium]|nr:penicillin-binding transpeptidase domain-containing protein [Polyangiaceae bacterium]
MARLSRWFGIGAALGIAVALWPIVRGNTPVEEQLTKLRTTLSGTASDKLPDLRGLDLLRLDLRPSRVVAPLMGGKSAELTLDPNLQRTATAVMRQYRVPEAGLVMMDVRTGKLLVYASHVNDGERFDVNARAEPPAASIFKVVTAAALIEKAGLNGSTEQCYHGGRSAIYADELRDDPVRDKWCVSLGAALGRSLNVVFGRLAQKHLTPESLTATAGAFGFGAQVPFAVPNDPSKLEIPVESLEFARSAAGFWHSNLSPLAAVVLAQTVANGGVAFAPQIVESVFDGKKKLWESDGKPKVLRRAIKADTATELGRMLLETVEGGSAFSAFHDPKGSPFLPGIKVAGKTGTLTRDEANRFYTWFVGYAPADKPEVAIASLVVNTPTWRIKGPQLARDLLRAYFAAHGFRGVTPPL